MHLDSGLNIGGHYIMKGRKRAGRKANLGTGEHEEGGMIKSPYKKVNGEKQIDRNVRVFVKPGADNPPLPEGYDGWANIESA